MLCHQKQHSGQMKFLRNKYNFLNCTVGSLLHCDRWTPGLLQIAKAYRCDTVRLGQPETSLEKYLRYSIIE